MEEVKAFYRLANEYCILITRKITIESIPELMEYLMKLYISAMNLPEIDPETTDSQSLENLETVSILFDEQILTSYWEMFDPFVQEESVCGDLYDDLSGIATDLLRGIKEYEAKRIGNAVFEWRFGLNTHWGKHVVDALCALHAIRTL